MFWLLTRELALQVAEAMEGFAENLPKLRVVAVYGGTGYGEQIKEFKRGAPNRGWNSWSGNGPY